MPLTSAYAAGYRARTKVYRGNIVLEMMEFDPVAGGLSSVGNVRSFELIDTPATEGTETWNMNVAEDSVATALLLANCQFRLDGKLYKVAARREPVGANRRLWHFMIEPLGSENTT